MRDVYVTNHDRWHAEIGHFVKEANAAQSDVSFRRVRLREADRAKLLQSPLDVLQGCRTAAALRPAYGIDEDDIWIVVLDANLADDEDDEYFFSGKIEEEGLANVGLVSLYYLDPGSTFMREGSEWWASIDEEDRRRNASGSVLLNLLAASALMATNLSSHDETRGCVDDYCQAPTDIEACLRGGLSFCNETCRPHLENAPQGRPILRIAERLRTHPFRRREIFAGEFDVFLCHSSADKPAVREVARRLAERGLVPWLDEEQLRPGFPWQRVLEEQISKIRSAAVFIGPDGPGPWQQDEIDALLRGFKSRRCPVIPVVLSEAVDTPAIPVFLQGFTWVDFRAAQPDPLERLIWGITGEKGRT